MNPIVISITKATEFVGLSESTLYRRVKDGTLTAIKLGGRTMFRVSDLEQMVAEAPTKQ